MAPTLSRTKGRRGKDRFAGIPHAVMRHPDYICLSRSAQSMLFELAFQYNGYNNGDLTVAWTVFKKRGWRSKATLSRSLRELIDKDFVRRSRTGWFANPGSRCALYAITWQNVDECAGKRLEIASTNRPLRAFSLECK